MATLRFFVVLALYVEVSMFMATCMASDADPLQDFCVTDPHTMFGNGFACKSAAKVKASDFKSGVLREAGNTSNPLGIALTLASAANVGGLNTQGLSFARIDYAKGGLVPPHVHPRASEILFVVEGTLTVGFVDTTNTLFTETLQRGDLFVFPRGLVHFIYNAAPHTAFTLSSLNSQNPGASLVANALFGAHPPISDTVLEMAFQLSKAQVQHLKKVFG